MPTDKDFKRIVRQRMEDTGERFTVARAALTEAPVDPAGVDRGSTLPARGSRWIELLGDPQQNQGAFDLLKALRRSSSDPSL